MADPGPMTAEEYEQLVAELVDAIRARSSVLAGLALGSGTSNRILGASGYAHQIDVSIVGPGRLFLIECKRWKANVGVDTALIHAARKLDIEAAHEGATVEARIVTTRGFTAGAGKIAGRFAIGMDVVRSAEEFAIKVDKHIRAGIHNGFRVVDEFRND